MPEAASPTLFEQVLYLSGKAAPEQHRQWVIDRVDQPPTYGLGLLINLGGGLLGLVIAAAMLLSGAAGAATFIFVFVLLRVFVMPLWSDRTRQSCQRLLAKNGAAPTGPG